MDVPYLWHRKGKAIETESRLVVFWDRGWARGRTASGKRDFWGHDGNVLKLGYDDYTSNSLKIFELYT